MQIQQEEIKMNRTGFGEELCRRVLDILGEEYRAELSQVRKNNNVQKEVLYIRKESSECIPCFYMDELYRSYCEGENEAGLAEYMANIVMNECEQVRRQAQEFSKKEWIINRLFVRLLQRDSNEEWLKDAVYVEFLDLAAVFYVLTEDEETGVKSFQLPKYLWKNLELGSAEEYFTRIVENTRRLFPEKLWCMEYTVGECRLGEAETPSVVLVPPKEFVSQRLYVLSNHRRINGAAVLLYPELLQQLGRVFGGDYYVIPSSIHEVLLLKDTEDEDEGYLNRIVREVNEQHVVPEEVLANHVYHYSVEEGRLWSRAEE